VIELRETIFPDSNIAQNIMFESGFEYCEKLSFHILLSTVAICANSNF